MMMKHANALLILITLIVGSLFLTAPASAHLTAQHLPVHNAPVSHSVSLNHHERVDAALFSAPVVVQTAHMHQQNKNVPDGNMHDNFTCQYGCCADACAACCVFVQPMGPLLGGIMTLSRRNGLRHYAAPDNSLTLPATPPPRG